MRGHILILLVECPTSGRMCRYEITISLSAIRSRHAVASKPLASSRPFRCWLLSCSPPWFTVGPSLPTEGPPVRWTHGWIAALPRHQADRGRAGRVSKHDAAIGATRSPGRRPPDPRTGQRDTHPRLFTCRRGRATDTRFLPRGGFRLGGLDSYDPIAETWPPAPAPSVSVATGWRPSTSIRRRWTSYGARMNSHAAEIDGTRIAVGGDSAGGNLAAAVSLKARDLDLRSPFSC